MSLMECFSSRQLLAAAAADILARALAAPGARAFAAAGGTTPGPVYDRLAQRQLAWERLSVTLTDERWVEPDAEESNARLVRQRLLVGEAARARFLPLKGAGASPQADAAEAEDLIREILPFAAVLLGMGADGHFASLFPGAPELDLGLDLDGPRLCVPVAEAGLKPLVPRISLTARALTHSELLVVLISGEDKRAVIERVEAEPDYAPPVATILRQDRCPARVLWAP
jgi:6-phosphogluconolactonase